MKKEDLGSRMKLKEIIDMYHETIDKENSWLKYFYPFIGSSRISTGRT
jgi:hypothetical protein